MEELIDVSLQGGPESIPRTVSIERSKLQDGKLKIEYLGGYEHFERAVSDGGRANPDGAPPEVFRWTLRTKIAE